MAYRIIFLVLVGVIACGDDNRGGDDGNGTDDASSGDGTMGTIDGSTSDGPIVTADAGLGAACGTTTCTGTQECCLAGGGTGTCVAQGTCAGVAFVCDGPEDCGSQVCCYGGQGGTGGSECKPASQCQINACHADTDCGGSTPKCCAIMSSPYNMCLAQCPP
jgi:hypothetical protein